MIETAICASFEDELVDGVHQPDDEYRLTLFAAQTKGTYGSMTCCYDDIAEEDEADGEGFPDGGIPLTNRMSERKGAEHVISWDPVDFGPMTIETSGLMVYNATREGRAVYVQRFDRPIGLSNQRLVMRQRPSLSLLKPQQRIAA
jgi:hypothetical protein